MMENFWKIKLFWKSLPWLKKSKLLEILQQEWKVEVCYMGQNFPLGGSCLDTWTIFPMIQFLLRLNILNWKLCSRSANNQFPVPVQFKFPFSMLLALLHHWVSEAQTHHIYWCWWYVTLSECVFDQLYQLVCQTKQNDSLHGASDQTSCVKHLIQYWSNSFPFLSLQRINWIFSLFFCTTEKPYCGTSVFWLQKSDGSGTSVIPMHNVIELYSSSANTVQETTKLSHFESERKSCESRGKIPNSISGRNLPLICSGRNSCL